jgi:hypothetical protein
MADHQMAARELAADDEIERQIRLSDRLAAIEAHLVEIDRRQHDFEQRLASLGLPGEAAVIDLAGRTRSSQTQLRHIRQVVD